MLFLDFLDLVSVMVDPHLEWRYHIAVVIELVVGEGEHWRSALVTRNHHEAVLRVEEIEKRGFLVILDDFGAAC